jgi:hypothetical protein
MAKIIVELDAYVIPDDHLVFKLSPGKTYRFYRAVHEARAVFMDIRGLDRLPSKLADWDDKAVLKIIADDRWNRELQSRERGNQPKGSPGVGKIDRRNLTFLKRLLFEGKKGDLVVVGAPGYINDVLVGELLTEAKDVRPIVAKDGDAQHVYMGRPVKWRAEVEKRLLPEPLINAVHEQTAIFIMGRSLREDVYRLAYGNFIYDGRYVAEFRTAKGRFTAEDSAVVSTWLNGFDVVRNAVERGESLPRQSFHELGLSKLPDGQAADLRINIQSPGEIFVGSKTPFALALMAMFALSSCDSKQVVDNGVTVHLKTVGAASKDPQAQVESCVNSIAIALGEARLNSACQLGTRAEGDAKMSTGATLKSRPKRGK